MYSVPRFLTAMFYWFSDGPKTVLVWFLRKLLNFVGVGTCRRGVDSVGVGVGTCRRGVDSVGV